MNILIDIGHPAHVHLFRNFAHEMIARGHKVLFSCRDKEFEIALLKANNFDFISFGKKYKTTISKLWGLIKFDFKEWQVCRSFKPDILMSHGSPYAAHAAKLYGVPHIAFEDTYNMEQIRLYEPFSEIVITGDYQHPTISKKELRLPTYHELAYLTPSRFCPDTSILSKLKVEETEPYTVVRFVSWKASHDIGHKGISLESKIHAVHEFSKYGRVFISSEGDLPKELEAFRLQTAPEKIFDVLANAALVWGESSTMSEEASVLGVPSVYFNNNSTYYTRHLERDYQLMYNLSESEDSVKKGIALGIEILKDKAGTAFAERRNKMLEEKIDLTDFLVWFIEIYPNSRFSDFEVKTLLKRFPIKNG